MSLVLGVNSAHADASAVLVSSDGIVAAIAEERLSRVKHSAGFPRLAIKEVLRIAGASIDDVTDVAIARDPKANLAAKLRYVATEPKRRIAHALKRLAAHRKAARVAALMADAIGTEERRVRASFHRVEHHLAHIASAYYCSPFEHAAGISVDGAGDFASSMIARCVGRKLEVVHRTLWPHSVGVYYTALSQFIGFGEFGEEHKVMGLAAFGAPRFVEVMKALLSYDRARGIRLRLDFFDHCTVDMSDASGVTIPRLFSPKLETLLGPSRTRGEPIDDRIRDIAHSMQTQFERVYIDYVSEALRMTGERDATVAGGCALNSVANGLLVCEGHVNRMYVHPAASDDGTAAGAALYVFHRNARQRTPPLTHAYLGTSFRDAQVENAVLIAGFPFKKLARTSLLDEAATALSRGKIIGWFQGREEWGPRALGNRSILCHPGWPSIKDDLNARVKNRELFRPFAPVCALADVTKYFEGNHEVPFMTHVYKVRPSYREQLSAVTHVDGTARVQTVEREQNELFFDLLRTFEQKAGLGVLLNTSFNENEPIVHSPEEALACFGRTKMDHLAIGSFFLSKS